MKPRPYLETTLPSCLVARPGGNAAVKKSLRSAQAYEWTSRDPRGNQGEFTKAGTITGR